MCEEVGKSVVGEGRMSMIRRGKRKVWKIVSVDVERTSVNSIGRKGSVPSPER